MIVELLQQVGLNKYEAEAYAALLAHGPLTGYELGKRSGVPLSRSYEVLERLSAQGLALVQPGEPPRYRAEEPQQLVGRLRRDAAATFDALAAALAALPPAQADDGFWVARGHVAVIGQARGLIEGARQTLVLSIAPAHADALAQPLEEARSRGCRIVYSPLAAQSAAALVFLLADQRAGLIGALAPADGCRAVVSSHPALLAVLARSLAPQLVAPAPQQIAEEAQPPQRMAWLDWEQHKQRRLLQQLPDDQVA